MTNASFVGMFYDCSYDAVKSCIVWDNKVSIVKVLLGKDGKATSAFESYEEDDGSWSEWKVLPMQVCSYVNEGLAKAEELGIALNDLGRVVLDNDLSKVVLA